MAKEQRTLAITNLQGMDLGVDKFVRKPNTWSLLLGFDLYSNGSIRKTGGFQRYSPELGTDIIGIRNYRRTPESTLLVVGIGKDGVLYDLQTANPLSSIPEVYTDAHKPSICILPGIDEARSSSDGAGFSAGISIDYFVFTGPTGTIYKWNGVPGVVAELVGCPFPVGPLYLSTITSGPASDTNPGLFINEMRRYRYTYWNPTTRHESSMSPDYTEGDIMRAGVGPRTPIAIPADKPYVVQLAFEAPGIPGTNQDRGYTRMRIYATRDGGSEFFLVRDTIAGFVNAGVYTFEQADSDGSLPIATDLIYDGVADILNTELVETGLPLTDLRQPYSGAIDPRNPVDDPSLAEPGPSVGANDPLPDAVIMTVHQGRLWLVPVESPGKLQYTKTLEFESLPVDNRFQLGANDFDSIVALEPKYQELVVGRRTGSDRLLGTDATDFTVVTLDAEVSFVAHRGCSKVRGQTLFLSQEGFMLWSSDFPVIVGRSVKPITDSVPEDARLDRILSATDTTQGFGLVTLPDTAPVMGQETGQLLVIFKPEAEYPFSLVLLPSEALAMQEVVVDGERFVLISLEGRGVFKMFVYGSDVEVQVAGLAFSQLLPIDEPFKRKMIDELRVVGENIKGFTFSLTSDSFAQVQNQPLRRVNKIGTTGYRFFFTLNHTDLEFIAADGPPLLSVIEIDYTILDRDRG